MLTRDAILAADDLPREKVTVPAWGGDVWVRRMSADDRDAYFRENERLKVERKGQGENAHLWDVDARLAVRCVCDEAGALLFTPEDVARLRAKSGEPLDLLWPVILRLNFVGAAEIEDAEGKSEGTPSAEPSFGSASPSESPTPTAS